MTDNKDDKAAPVKVVRKVLFGTEHLVRGIDETLVEPQVTALHTTLLAGRSDDARKLLESDAGLALKPITLSPKGTDRYFCNSLSNHDCFRCHR